MEVYIYLKKPDRYSVVENVLKLEAAFLILLNIAIEVSFFFDKTDDVCDIL